KVVWEMLARQAGVNSLLHTLVVDVLTEDDRVTGIVAVNKGGFITISAQVVVDASGDADVAAAAGVPFESAERGPLQAMTTTFKLINVDVDQASLVSKDQLHRLMVEAAETGPYDVTPQGNVTLTPMTGVMSANMTRLTKLDPVDPRQLSQAERVGRSQAMEYFRFMRDKVPGYENAELIDFSTQIGIRESRRIVGAYRLTRDDILSGREFDDAIAKGAWPIEDHRPDGTTVQALARTYEIPYRCLLPRKVEGLLIAGRCLSADHAAHASVRVMAQCMAMGQAAGLAAAITSRRSVLLRRLSIEKLKDRLRKIGAVI
ncbi:MAG: FAD-dependent oxidoreductase, partial [Anaerolineae bacterium]|nr:FAD-dependent oxidoreductase [Anaerolineae bacterium]